MFYSKASILYFLPGYKERERVISIQGVPSCLEYGINSSGHSDNKYSLSSAYGCVLLSSGPVSRGSSSLKASSSQALLSLEVLSFGILLQLTHMAYFSEYTMANTKSSGRWDPLPQTKQDPSHLQVLHTVPDAVGCKG